MAKTTKQTKAKTTSNDVFKIVVCDGIRYMLDTSTSRMHKLEDQPTEQTAEKKASVIEESKSIKDFIELLNKRKISHETFNFNGVIMVHMLQKLTNSKDEYKTISEDYRLNSCVIGSGYFTHQRVNLIYCKDEVGDILQVVKSSILPKLA